MATRQPAGGSSRRRLLRQWVGRCFLWLAVLLVLYVLSTGPVGWLMFKGLISPEVIEAVYAPFGWLEQTEGGRAVLMFVKWYGETLWGWGLEIAVPPG